MADGEANVALRTISQANSLFTFDIYGTLANGTGNLFFSPISIQLTLALIYLGARGNAAKQLATGLRLPDDRNVVEEGFSAIISQLQEKNDVLLDIANRVFINTGFDIKQEFNQSAIRLKAGTEEVNFSQEQQAREVINTWVENNTNQKIKNLIAPGVLDALTQLVLVNAIYFKGDWLKKFNKDLTSPAQFHVAGGATRNVDMMKIKGEFKYSVIFDITSHVLLLPYKGEEVNMMIILPIERNGLPNVEKKLASINIQDILSTLIKLKVDVFLPKFKLEYEKDLKETLKTLGVTDIFEVRKANLTGISDEPLAVSQVQHKAFIEVNEEGTEAAAATEGGIQAYSAPRVFRADHPFMFLILDQRTQSVLFAGRYVTPP